MINLYRVYSVIAISITAILLFPESTIAMAFGGVSASLALANLVVSIGIRRKFLKATASKGK